MTVKRELFNKVPLEENRFWAEQKYGKIIEHRGKKWIYIQPAVDVMTRLFGASSLKQGVK